MKTKETLTILALLVLASAALATEVMISCSGWCFLAQNYSSSTLKQIDANNSNDTIHGWFNSSSQLREGHNTNYRFNENITVPQKWGYQIFFNRSTNVNVTIVENVTISLKTGLNLVGNMNASARNLSVLKTNITNATAASYYNRTSRAWETNNSTLVPAGEAFYVTVSASTNWSG